MLFNAEKLGKYAERNRHNQRQTKILTHSSEGFINPVAKLTLNKKESLEST